MRSLYTLLVKAMLALALCSAASEAALPTHTAQAAALAAPAAQEPGPTSPAATPQQGSQRKRLEAPPLQPQAAGLLIGINLLVAAGIVGFAFALRRRRQRQ
ncbi:hypothetical protein F8S13_15820 [Chloroflexia bacterium SDU3-3]|nr:hypothetical protein F8S13_15820 [Chloroflexia bacterium SDU3-3]